VAAKLAALTGSVVLTVVPLSVMLEFPSAVADVAFGSTFVVAPLIGEHNCHTPETGHHKVPVVVFRVVGAFVAGVPVGFDVTSTIGLLRFCASSADDRRANIVIFIYVPSLKTLIMSVAVSET
jgi:hypothetical protein